MIGLVHPDRVDERLVPIPRLWKRNGEALSFVCFFSMKSSQDEMC